MLSPNKNNYSRSVFTIMGLFGNVGGVYGLLQSVWGVLVGFVSSQIMLASVFRRLYYTNKNIQDCHTIKIDDRSRKVGNKPIEENKEHYVKTNDILMKRIESRPLLFDNHIPLGRGIWKSIFLINFSIFISPTPIIMSENVLIIFQKIFRYHNTSQ